MADKIRLSVVIPYHNEGALLGRCLESVFTQSFDGELEVIVVDDASQRRPPDEIIKKWPVRLIRSETPLYAAGARQLGIDCTQGKYVCFIDSDDAFAEDRYQAHVDCFEQNADVAIVVGKHYVHRDRSWLETPPIIEEHYPEALDQPTILPDTIRHNICRRYSFWTGAITVRRSALEQSQGFDGSYRWGEEWDLLVRLAQVGRVAYIPSLCAHYYCRTGSITSTLTAAKFASTARMYRNWRRQISDLPSDICKLLRSKEHQQLLLAAQVYLEQEYNPRAAFRCCIASFCRGASWWGVRSTIRSATRLCLSASRIGTVQSRRNQPPTDLAPELVN